MTILDKIGRSLFVALAVGLGWGIRGDFGHVIGAMYPGAALGLAFAYVSGQRSLFRWMPILAAGSAMAIGSGGTMSYGILHGYAQSDSFLNYAYGFITLFLQGAAWGTFGGAFIGLMLERTPLRTSEWLGLVGSILFGGWFLSFLVVNVCGFHINPPRNNSSIAFFGAALGQLIWLARNGKYIGLRGGLLGYFGFGLGMAGGRFLGNVANVLLSKYDFTINHWNVMEVSCGFIGGLIYCFGMVDHSYDDPPEEKNIPLVSFYGILYVLGVIPLWHRLARIDPVTKPVEWAKSLQSYGYADPPAAADRVLWMMDGVCLLGFVGAGLWLLVHIRGARRWAAFPILWLSATMLLFQNLNALYFFYPTRPKTINMHNVFWAMFALMALYVCLARPRPSQQLSELLPFNETRSQWRPIVFTGLSALALIILLAGFVNGPKTRITSNTRWPIWSWQDDVRTKSASPMVKSNPAASP